MAKAKKVAVNTESLLGQIAAAGFEEMISTQKTKLWGKPKTVIESLDSNQYEFYVSKEFENSSFITIREGDQSTLINMKYGEVDTDDYDAEDNGLVKDFDETLKIVQVTALRDDEEFGVEEGDIVLKAIIA